MEAIPRILIVDDNESIHEDIRNVLAPRISQENETIEEMEKELFDRKSKEISNAESPVVYRIDDTFQGEDAITLVEQAAWEGNPYSLIIMDVRMPPGIDGVQTVERIWRNYPDVQIIICSAYADYSWQDIREQLGITHNLLFLNKPFDADSLRQMALAMTRKWDLDRQNHIYIAGLEELVADRTRELQGLLKEKEGFIKAFQEDMDFAQRVQRHFLPRKLPRFDTLDIAARYIPTAKVSGDFYDVIPLSGSLVAFLIADVTGHGIAASLVTAICKPVFDMNVRETQSPAQTLERVNKEICRCTPEDIFVSAFLLILDRQSGAARFSAAGHPPAMLYHAFTRSVESLTIQGLLLGVKEDATYYETDITLTAGDMFLLYTDGLTESENGGKYYGKTRLLALIEDNGGLTTDLLLQCILDDNEGFVGRLARNDDICLLACKLSCGIDGNKSASNTGFKQSLS